VTGGADIERLAASTTLCISLADRPSRFGITVHNAAFRALDLDYLYKAIRPVDLASAVAGIRGLGIRGCGVSMPYKIAVMDHLDEIDPDAMALGAVNTIVNDGGHLKGYNTDASAAQLLLSEAGLQSDDHVLLLGAGGVSRALVYALFKLGVAKVTVAARNLDAARELSAICPIVPVAWEDRETIEANVLINATPIGMRPDIHELPVGEVGLHRFRLVYDVVADPPETRLASLAAGMEGVAVVGGQKMAVYQAGEQFRLYTGREAPLDVMFKAAAELVRTTSSN
jgi:shikimate dehydrogenase